MVERLQQLLHDRVGSRLSVRRRAPAHAQSRADLGVRGSGQLHRQHQPKRWVEATQQGGSARTNSSKYPLVRAEY
jgi:hypothetical protein